MGFETSFIIRIICIWVVETLLNNKSIRMISKLFEVDDSLIKNNLSIRIN